MSTKTLIGVLLAGVVGIVIFLFVHPSSDPNKTIEIGTAKATACSKAAGDCLPEVKYVDTSGVAYTPESLNGKVVVVNFWATWCHPCEKEIPDFSRVYDRFKARGVVFLGVVSDNPPPSDAQLLNFQSDHEMSYPIVRVNSELLSSFNFPQSLPTTFIYNRGGKQVYSQVGAMSESKLSGIVEQYVAEK
jgi:thiol-disulfide isomerase/thioredoxin